MRNYSPYRPQSPPPPTNSQENQSLTPDSGFPPWLIYGSLLISFIIVTVLTNLNQLGEIPGAAQVASHWTKGDRPRVPAPIGPTPIGPSPTPLVPPNHGATPAPSVPPVAAGQPPAQIYQQAHRSVVAIHTGSSQGSGALIRHGTTTLIVTNDHVVDDNAVVRVETIQGLTYEGIVRGRDGDRDLAIVEISTPLNLPSLSLQVSDPTIGEVVYALGNPIGLERTLTEGIISRIDPESGDIQHSADIAPGSSGSPLLNDQGRVIRVNKAVFSQFDDLAIATPAEDVVNLCDRLTPP